jgi:hypothetical protein
MAGTIPGFSLAQQLDSDGTPLVGCKLYTIQAGTTSTPQTAYQDSGLTLPWPYPVLGDAFGRLPQIFLADGSIKLRLTRSNDTQVFVLDGVLVVGASSGGGGGSPVDPTTVLSTGDIKIAYNTGVYNGFVRANGRTIGSPTSGATERANADCQALFAFLWGNDPNLAVSGSRGASAAVDWAANKTIALPDFRGRVIGGLDDMGASAAGRLTSTYLGTSATVLGASGGGQSVALSLSELPTGITSNGSATVSVALSSGAARFPYSSNGDILGVSVPSGGPFVTQYSAGNNWTLANGMSGSGTAAVTSNNTSGNAHRTVQPTILVTTYIKL